MSDDSVRKDCTAYTENMAEGRHDEEWLVDAWTAHEERKAGDFDGFLNAKFEQDWGVERRAEASSPRRRASVHSPPAADATEYGDLKGIRVKKED